MTRGRSRIGVRDRHTPDGLKHEGVDRGEHGCTVGHNANFVHVISMLHESRKIISYVSTKKERQEDPRRIHAPLALQNRLFVGNSN